MAGLSDSEIIIYQTQDGRTKIDVRMDDETVWLTQIQMAELFQTTKQNISLHINNAFKEGEIEPSTTVKEYLTVQNEGKREVSRSVKHYNLDVIISVGYRVKSLRGTQFRRWALEVLKEYLRKGFAMNDDLLKKAGGGDYWKELLERIRDIRFAAHGHTAAEVIAQRANSELPFMGLTSFSGEHPTKVEASIAKNYLTEDELAALNRMVSAFFDLAELRAMQHQLMYMRDWLLELDDFSKRYGKGVLLNAGTVSHQAALEKATAEYEKYRQRTIDELSPAERDFLASIKDTQKTLEGKAKRGKKDGEGE
jgi:hypothetical protein